MVNHDNKRHAILCVYMPCMSAASANDDKYLECLGFLMSSIDELNCTCVTVLCINLVII